MRIGNITVRLSAPVFVKAFASAVGPKELQGPLGKYFDKGFTLETLGEKSFEKAESKLQQTAFSEAVKKSGLCVSDLELICAGDLLNQCIGSAYSMRDTEVPFTGLYGACSTMALSLIVASTFIEAGSVRYAAALTSSHFCSSERQFRFPLEYGSQRTPTAQWTVTGAGAVILSSERTSIAIKEYAVGRIKDYGVKDINNMGAAMAPAAADTLITYFADTKTVPRDYDLILTGDLGFTGSSLLLDIMKQNGINLQNHNDCGMMIFDRKRQDVHSGGSGCGCSASVLCSKILRSMEKGELHRVLFCATGALMSPVSLSQGESIPGICHTVLFEKV